jgi:hypothetical protein
MYIFKFRWEYYILDIFSIVFATTWILLFGNWLSTILLLISLIIAIILFINGLATRLIYDNSMIQEKSLFNEKSIKLCDIQEIVLLPPSKGKKVFVGVFSKHNCINVTFWFSNYKSLLMFIVQYCKKKGTVKIDPKVFDVLKM